MELPAEIQKIWDILTPEQQAEVMAELTAAAPGETEAAPETEPVPAKSDAEIFAEHNLPGTPDAMGCVCVVCERVRAAASVAA